MKPWQQPLWCLPSASADFVAAMEHILDLYEHPYDPGHPKVCFDESSKQLIEQRPCPARPIVFHYTPKHGSWLNMAEIEFSVLMRKLGTHVPD